MFTLFKLLLSYEIAYLVNFKFNKLKICMCYHVNVTKFEKKCLAPIRLKILQVKCNFNNY